MMKFAWVIPIFPLLSFVLLLLFGKRLRDLSAYLGTSLMSISFVLSAIVLVERLSEETYKHSITWLQIGDIQLTVGFEINPLNALMLCIVSLVSFLVHQYSKVYMYDDSRIRTFYAYLGLFTFAMLGLVISPNLLQLFMFWELVGLGSFLLIGFYFYKESAKKAAQKAFIMTRIGDVGLLVGMLLIFSKVGTFEFQDIFDLLSYGAMTDKAITASAILIFIGAMGKSGQFPLHSWLPDAMEGPTPVSALIHAATMVAAGVYLVATMFPLFAASKTALTVVAIVGAVTAIFAASIGLVQTDIKKILAYSTVSQLGYMMLALGSAGYVAGVFHLTTHAFFKALLFLAAGSVIHAVHTQNIMEMGGLWKKMRFTGPLFLIGTLAITGFPLFSGFFSKDEILVSAWHADNPVLFWLVVTTVLFTSFYMFRLFFKVFFGKPSLEATAVTENSNDMIWPMFTLGFLAIVSGFLSTPWTGDYLGRWLLDGNPFIQASHNKGPEWIMFLSVGLLALGVLLAWLMYVQKAPYLRFLQKRNPIHALLSNKYYIDELYEYTIIPATKTVGVGLSLFELIFIKGAVKGIVASTNKLSQAVTKLQNGQVQAYGAFAIFGLAVILIVYAFVGGWK